MNAHTPHLTFLALAIALDARAGGPPAALHPVVHIGRLIGLLERRAPHSAGVAAQLAYGAGLALAVPSVAAGLAALTGRGAGEVARRFGPPGRWPSASAWPPSRSPRAPR